MEYEYSFYVENINKYIDYCKANKYNFVSKNHQIRIIYRNSNKTIARITINNNKNIYLDFKEDKLSDEILIQRKETPSIEITDIKSTEKILEFLNYKKDNTLERERIIYKNKGVKFEIDSYLKPDEKYVIAIEGVKEEVDKVYKDIINI